MSDFKIFVIPATVSILCILCIIYLLVRLVCNRPKPFLEIHRQQQNMSKDESTVSVYLCNKGDKIARINKMYLQFCDDVNSRKEITNIGLGLVFSDAYLPEWEKVLDTNGHVFEDLCCIRAISSGQDFLLMTVTTTCVNIKAALIAFTETYSIVVVYEDEGFMFSRQKEEILPLNGIKIDSESEEITESWLQFFEGTSQYLIEALDSSRISILNRDMKQLVKSS